MSEQQTISWDAIRDSRVVVPGHVVHRSFASETVLLNIQSGHYHGMDAVGGRFFDVFREASSVTAAVETLAAEYDQPVERIREDAVKFLDELLQLGLIELPS